MSKPVILAVDDDLQVLAAVRRDLRNHYGPTYQVMSASSGTEALEAVHELKSRSRTIAAFVVDQRMPEMSGTEFLMAADQVFPQAKRLLLTAYADTEAAIQAINDVGLDHYLLKPWSPPEERLYPILDDVLDDWQANADVPFDGIRVLGTTWSPTTYEAKAFLARNEVPYRFIDIERDSDAAVAVASATGTTSDLPVVFLQDDTVLINPSKHELAEAAGIHSRPEAPFYDLAIVGGGPAGLAAAVYGASEGLSTVMIEREAPGGQAGTSSRIENYLGFPKGISGADLARRAIAQATRLGAELITAAEVAAVRSEPTVKTLVMTDGTELKSRALLIASGMTVRRLDVPGYSRFEGAGVYYGAAATEASTYRDRHVYIIGGANSAGQAAVMFSKTSSIVTMVVRSDDLGKKMSQYLVDQIATIENIEVLLSRRVVEVVGAEHVEEIRLENVDTGEEETRAASALFVFVGAVPHSGFLEGTVAMNDRGFIYTGSDVTTFTTDWPLSRDPYPLETSAPGVFASGDVREGAVRRVASAVGEGSVAVTLVHRYLDTV
ncbi:MAG: FAD-dependent oxidoreductase [Actinomycetota bacterium]|nr:FAD-dependent oxidoreductase [Actinomycetota bacterium]